MSTTASEMFATRAECPIERIEVNVYTVPTDVPEGDGTLRWDATTVIVVHAHAGGRTGLGYSYAAAPTGALIHGTLSDVVVGIDAFDIVRAWQGMVDAVRNLGRPGLASHAISAVDIALWDLKARLLDVSVARLLGSVRDATAVYGSGGFTTYDERQLTEQLSGWVADGITMVKMKVGASPSADPARVRTARAAIGPDAKLFVDANGAYTRKQALGLAERFSTDSDVTWFEEPVSSDDLDGLRLLRDRAPASMAVAAGEYGYEPTYFQRMLGAGAVDVLQADATRCGGITGLMQVGALCSAHSIALSAHTAPAVHAQACCAIEPVVHLEYFHDHARIEQLLFDGAPRPVDGALAVDARQPGLGLQLRHSDAQRYAI